MEIKKALDKIKKCLALSKSSNEYEAAQALKHAHILMKKFNLDLDDVSKSAINKSVSETSASLTTWHSSLITTIATAFNVVAVLHDDFFGKRIVWHGHGVNSELADYTYHVLFKQCNRARTNYLKTNLRNVRKKANKTLRANAYAEAWCNAIHSTVLEFVSEEDRTIRKEIHELVAKELPHHKPRDRNQFKKAASHVKDAANNDYWHGQKDGRGVKLHRPVGTNNKPLAIE